MSATLLDRYADAWCDGVPDRLAALWDADRFRLYKAEEIAHAFRRWDEVLAYWHANVAMHERVRLAFSDAVEAPIEGGWSLLWFHMRWDIRFRADAPSPLAGKAMGGDNHVLALLHDGRFAGWSETPDAPISYVRHLYEAQARGV